MDNDFKDPDFNPLYPITNNRGLGVIIMFDEVESIETLNSKTT
jgi:hypothetical protein